MFFRTPNAQKIRLHVSRDRFPSRSNQCFEYGFWSSLSESNLNAYVKNWAAEPHEGFVPWFGWLSNSPKGFPETLNLKFQVWPGENGKRPPIELEPADHPLAVERRDGITLGRLMEICRANGQGPN